MILNQLSDTSIGGDLYLPISRVPLYSLLVAAAGTADKVKLVPSLLKQDATGLVVLPTATNIVLGSITAPFGNLHTDKITPGADVIVVAPTHMAAFSADPTNVAAGRHTLKGIEWESFKSLLGTGTQGPKGDPGEKWFTGSAAGGSPSGTLSGSIIGDWFLDSDTGNYHEKTGATAWTLRGNLKGTNGSPGTPGSRWYSTVANPTAGLGVTNDFAINISSYDYFEKINSSTWNLLGNIKGATGAAGTTGAQGIQGPAGATGSQGPQGPKGDPGSNATVGSGTVSWIPKFATTTTLADSAIQDTGAQINIGRATLITGGLTVTSNCLVQGYLESADLRATGIFTHGGIRVPTPPTGDTQLYALRGSVSGTGNAWEPFTSGGGGGSGTVTSVSVPSPGNGITATVTNPTTAASIALGLGPAVTINPTGAGSLAVSGTTTATISATVGSFSITSAITTTAATLTINNTTAAPIAISAKGKSYFTSGNASNAFGWFAGWINTDPTSTVSELVKRTIVQVRTDLGVPATLPASPPNPSAWVAAWDGTNWTWKQLVGSAATGVIVT